MYYLLVAAVTLITSSAAFFLMRSLIHSNRVSVEDAKGYFMVLIFVSTFFACSVAYFTVSPAPVPAGEEPDPKAALGVLLAVAISITVLATGLLNLKERKLY